MVDHLQFVSRPLFAWLSMFDIIIQLFTQDIGKTAARTKKPAAGTVN
ncbi:hypothetical protein [Mesorhizobium silamurunense]|nr:hypothetical protein [Mesorhizobium silamurunense]